MRRFLLILAILLVCAQQLQAQLLIGLTVKRKFFMMYEPILATVTVKNLAGRDITLSDSATQSWFGFQITRPDGQLVPPLNPDYKLSPLTIPAGQTLKRSVVLNTLFPVRDLGPYRVRATIFDAANEKYYQSPHIDLEISEGKTVWQETVGVPAGVSGAGGTRKLSLLSFRQADYSYLYVRVEDTDASIIYMTLPLGKLMASIEPDVQIDLQNTLHVLQVAGPKTYLYSHIGLNGELLAQNNVYSTNARPVLRRDKSGMVALVGGELQDPSSAFAKEKGVNKLSDRPVLIPKE